MTKKMSKEGHSPRAGMQLMLFAAGLYLVCSGAMNFVNKLVLNYWSFKFPEAILLAQLLFTVAGLKLLKHWKKVNLACYDKKSAKSCALLSLFFSSNTCLGKY